MTRTHRLSRRFFLGTLLTFPAFGVARAGWLDDGLDALKSFKSGAGGEGLSSVEIGRGLKEALEIASENVVAQVGQTGGYLNDKAIHIPLPGYLAKIRNSLRIIGADGLLTELETQLNRAAEVAAPEAKQIFFESIERMTLDDARQILNGPDDAATQYFRRTMSPSLRETFRPIITEKLAETGAMRTLDQTVTSYEKIPLARNITDDAQGRLIDHGLDGALDGIFHYMAREEAAIRQNPAKRTTDLLRRVFG